MPSRRQPRLAAVAAGVLLAVLPLVVVAQGLVDKVKDRMAAAEPGEAGADGPVALLRRSAEFVSKQPRATLDFAYHLKMGKGEQAQQADSSYRLLLGEEGRFAVGSLEGTQGPQVHSDGEEMVVLLPGEQRQAVRYRVSHGLAAFAGSPPARMIGHGLGGLTLSLLSDEAGRQVLASVTDQVDLGAETIVVDGREHACRHGRVTIGDLTWDFWVDAGDQPLLRRIVPDLSGQPAEGAAAEETETATLTIDFNRWDLAAPLADGAFVVAEPPHPMLGKPAPPLTLPMVEGDAQRLADLIGKKVILLDFWATWCPPCVASLPTLDSVAREYADKGVVAIAVNAGEDAEAISTFLAERDWELPVAQDLDGRIMAALKAGNGLPTSVLIGLDGRVHAVEAGVPGDPKAHRKKLVEAFEALIAKKDLAGEAIERWRAVQAVFAIAK